MQPTQGSLLSLPLSPSLEQQPTNQSFIDHRNITINIGYQKPSSCSHLPIPEVGFPSASHTKSEKEVFDSRTSHPPYIGLPKQKRDDPPPPLQPFRSKFATIGRLMVRLLRKRHSLDSKTLEERAMFEGRQAHSLTLESGGGNGNEGNERMFRSQGSKIGSSLEGQQIGSALDRSASKIPRSRLSKDGGGASIREGPPSGKCKYSISLLI